MDLKCLMHATKDHHENNLSFLLMNLEVRKKSYYMYYTISLYSSLLTKQKTTTGLLETIRVTYTSNPKTIETDACVFD